LKTAGFLYFLHFLSCFISQLGEFITSNKSFGYTKYIISMMGAYKMNTYWLQFLGYLASFIVLVSLLMSSIIKLRWINLVGSAIFSVYGFLIGAIPVAVMNLGISLINVYYLIKIYSTKENFRILPVESNSMYLRYFLDFYHKDIEKYADTFTFDIKESSICFCILRNLVPAGIFIASEKDSSTLKVDFDFVIPEYRDFKIGSFIYEHSKGYFLERGYTRFISFTSNTKHIKYLKKMHFKEVWENGSIYFVKSIK
jgi:GNAT superfamily N-acetyltransferase